MPDLHGVEAEGGEKGLFVHWHKGARRVIDWLALIPLALLLAPLLLFGNVDPPIIWMLIIYVNIPFVFASILWLVLRTAEIRTAQWFGDYIAVHPLRRALFLLFVMFCSFTIPYSIKWLWIQ